MKAHIADEGNYRFYDGTVATNGEEFVAKVEQSYQEDLANGVAWEWTTDYAFAVYPSETGNDTWNEKGQWVNASFTGADGVEPSRTMTIKLSMLVPAVLATVDSPKTFLAEITPTIGVVEWYLNI